MDFKPSTPEETVQKWLSLATHSNTSHEEKQHAIDMIMKLFGSIDEAYHYLNNARKQREF